MVPPPASELDRQLAALKESVADAVPPPGTDRAIAAAIARAKRSPARRAGAANSDRWLAWPLALAASIAVLSFVVRSLPPEAIVAEPAPVARASGDEFLPVVPMADIEYRCPTHGPVEPEDLDAAVPTCPMILRREVGGQVVPEPCGQPLTAYLK